MEELQNQMSEAGQWNETSHRDAVKPGKTHFFHLGFLCSGTGAGGGRGRRGSSTCAASAAAPDRPYRGVCGHAQSLIRAVFQDARMRGFHGLNPAFFRSPHLLSDQGSVPADDSLALHRRNADLDGEYLETGSRSGLTPEARH